METESEAKKGQASLQLEQAALQLVQELEAGKAMEVVVEPEPESWVLEAPSEMASMGWKSPSADEVGAMENPQSRPWANHQHERATAERNKSKGAEKGDGCTPSVERL